MMGIVSSKLCSLLEKYKNKSFLVVEPGGNWGDRLIYLGAKKLFNFLGIKYRSLDFDSFMKKQLDFNDVIYIHGSGGFNPIWSQSPERILERAISLCDIVIIGPQTLYDENYIFELSKRMQKWNWKSRYVYFFAREKTSKYLLELLSKRVPITVSIDHDTALNVDKDDLKITLKKQYTLYAVREDKERTMFPLCSGIGIKVDPVLHANSFDEWVELHSRAKKIVTNRTHSCILGVILGKRVIFYPNSYHKNKSIYEFSLKEKVEFKENLQGCMLMSRINNSYKVQKLLRLIYGV